MYNFSIKKNKIINIFKKKDPINNIAKKKEFFNQKKVINKLFYLIYKTTIIISDIYKLDL